MAWTPGKRTADDASTADQAAQKREKVRVADDQKVRETAARIAARDKELLKRLSR